MKNFDEYNYNGFRYLKEYDLDDNKPLIEHKKEKPEFLYKFYSLTKYNIHALKNGYLYASHPIELNDCLDSSPFLLYTSKPIDFELYNKFFGATFEKNKQNLVEYWKEDAKPETLCKGYISNMYDVATNLFGIISMTAKENNPLMWPHYTQEKGFQIKFKTSKLENSIRENIEKKGEYLGLYPLNYTEQLSPIDIHPFKTFLIPLYYSTNVKSAYWKYEDEWRFLVSNHNMGVPYSKAGLVQRDDYHVNIENRYAYFNPEIIEEICLGINFFTAKEFNLEWVNEKKIRVGPKQSNDNGQNNYQKELLDFIVQKLKDKLFLSGLKYELDDNGTLYLIRTKEKLEINKEKGGFYILIRTNNIIRLI